MTSKELIMFDQMRRTVNAAKKVVDTLCMYHEIRSADQVPEGPLNDLMNELLRATELWERYQAAKTPGGLELFDIHLN